MYHVELDAIALLSSPQQGEGLGGGRVRIGASETLADPGIRDCPGTVNDYKRDIEDNEEGIC
jgi:hypothetical protein